MQTPLSIFAVSMNGLRTVAPQQDHTHPREWCETGLMVAAVHYFATIADQDALLDYLGEPDNVALAPWPIVSDPLVPLDRSAALTGDSVMIVTPALGAAVLIRPGEAALREPTRAGLFNRLNWERLQPGVESIALVYDDPGERVLLT